MEELIGMVSEHNDGGKQDYDPEDALAYVRGVANILNRLACGDQGGGWVYDEQMLLLLGRDLLEAADAIESALYQKDV